MNAYIIRIDDHKGQRESAQKLLTSIVKTGSVIQPVFFSATTPDTISDHLYSEFNYFKHLNYKWNYPTDPNQNHLDMATGLYKKAYTASDPKRVEACLISHMRLWDKCVTDDEPMVVIEADALFVEAFDEKKLDDYPIIGLNSPRGATRRAAIFDKQVSQCQGIRPVPTVNIPNEEPTPQGIAGNSAYYITPQGAKTLLDLVTLYGGWPNDAIMCKELIPNLRVIYPYFTRVQGTQSTTTG